MVVCVNFTIQILGKLCRVGKVEGLCTGSFRTSIYKLVVLIHVLYSSHSRSMKELHFFDGLKSSSGGFRLWIRGENIFKSHI
jgi:hypothetical protein